MSVRMCLLPRESLNKQLVASFCPCSAMKVGPLLPYKCTNEVQEVTMQQVSHKVESGL